MDPGAAMMGGVGGHAGLFSIRKDLDSADADVPQHG